MQKFLALLSLICIGFSICGMEVSAAAEQQALPGGVQELVLNHYFAAHKSYEDKINAATALVKKQPQSKAWASLILKALCQRFQVENRNAMAEQLPLLLSATLSHSFSMFLVMKKEVNNLSAPDCLPTLKNALFAAAAHGSAKALQFLAETLLNASKEQAGLLDYLHSLRDDQGKTVLMYAAEKGNVPVLLFLAPPKENLTEPLLSQSNDLLRDSLGSPEDKTLIYIDLPDSTGKTALILAVENGKGAAVEALLNGGADPEAMGSSSPWNALHAAIYKLHPDIVKLLLTRGADITSVCADYNTIQAAIFPDALLDDYLERKGLQRDCSIWEETHACLRKRSIETMKILLEHHDAPINVPDSSGDYPLHTALHHPELKESIAAMLLDAGADPTLPDRFGITGEELLQ